MKMTFNPHNRRKHKKHGFLSRSKSAFGRRTLKARRRKGRHRLAV